MAMTTHSPTHPLARTLLALLLGLSIAGCGRSPNGIDKAAHDAEIASWKKTRLERLTRENGWLTLCGLFWLKEGVNTVGADSASAVILPARKAPANAGTLTLDSGVVRLEALPGAGMRVNDSAVASLVLRSDADPAAGPTIVELGRLTFQIIKRAGQFGVRVRDNDNPARTGFKGLEYFPVDLKWRVVARFEPYVPPKLLKIPTMINTVEEDSCPGALVFELDGTEHRLDAVIEAGSEEKFFLMFGDATNGKETYGVGRQLYTDLPDSAGHVVVDFNKAYNWPCVFTVYATCPIPPRQNVLPVRIEAGEKMYGEHE
jgi:uncharacterized protein (DUF1684 family)